MTAIWLLPTKGRPELCQRVLDACVTTEMTSVGVVYVDETVDEYGEISLPDNWTIHYEPQWGGIAAAMQWVFQQWPDASQYGWIADDTFPRTLHWDKLLEGYAGKWKLAYGVDQYASEDKVQVRELQRGGNLGAPLCWGGDLVRAVGWWALPGVNQAGIDTAWCAIVHPLLLYYYATDVHADHANYRTGRRPKDATDSWYRGGVNFIQKDISTRNRWVASPDYKQTLNRVRAHIGRRR